MKSRPKRIDVEGIRLQLGCSMIAMAQFLGMSTSAYSMMENGHRKLPLKSIPQAEDLKNWIDEAQKKASGQTAVERKPEKHQLDELKSRFRKSASAMLDLRQKIERVEMEYRESMARLPLLKEMKTISTRDKDRDRTELAEIAILCNEIKLRTNNLNKQYQVRAELASKEAEVKYLAQVLDLKMPV